MKFSNHIKKILIYFVFFACASVISAVIVFGLIFWAASIVDDQKSTNREFSGIKIENLDANNSLIALASSSNFFQQDDAYILNFNKNTGKLINEVKIPQTTMFDKVLSYSDRIDFFSVRSTDILSLSVNGDINRTLYSNSINPALKEASSMANINDTYKNGDWRVELLNTGNYTMRYVIRNTKDSEFDQVIDIDYDGGIYAIEGDTLYSLQSKLILNEKGKYSGAIVAYDLKLKKEKYREILSEDIVNEYKSFLERSGHIFVDKDYVMINARSGFIDIYNSSTGKLVKSISLSNIKVNDIHGEDVIIISSDINYYFAFTSFGNIYQFDRYLDLKSNIEVQNKEILFSEPYSMAYLKARQVNGINFSVYRYFIVDDFYFHKYTYDFSSGKLLESVDFEMPKSNVEGLSYLQVSEFENN